MASSLPWLVFFFGALLQVTHKTHVYTNTHTHTHADCTEREKERERERESWCFEPSQPQRITSVIRAGEREREETGKEFKEIVIVSRGC